MRDRRRMNQLLGLGFAVLLAGFTAANYFHKDTAFSDTENRMLQQKPVFSWADLADGRFMGNFEKYQTDQFILRREWIRLQTAADRLLGKNKSGDVYLGEGQLLEEPSKLSENVWENLDAIGAFCQKQTGVKCYLMLVPDAASVQREKLPAYAPVADQAEQLEEIRSYPIAPINKAKISDFLWVVENDFSNAKIAETAYCEHLKNTGAFADHIMAINRILFISKKIRSKEINEEVRKNLLIKVLEEYDNSSHAKIGYLIKTAMEEKVDTGYLIPYVENILKTYDDNSCDALLIGKFCDLLEELYCRKNNWQKKKCITEPKLIAIRRRKIQAVRMEAEYAGASSKGNLMRKIHYLKEVIQLLKTIQGTEKERKALLQEIAQIEEASLSEMMVWSDKQDASGIVKELFRQLEDLDKEEALCYFASFLPIPIREKVKNQVLNRTGILNTIFPAAILGKGGKLIAKSRPVKKPDGTIDEGALKDNMERTAAMEMDYFAQILVSNTFEYIRSRFLIEESDVKKIVDVSCAIPEGRKESYTKGLMFGFSGDFLTALSILIPQIENAVRYLAVECGEPVYNMNEEGIEEIKSMHAVLELEGVKESLDEDLIFALNTIFCSKFGFNMRNNVAHGMLDDQAFQSFKALYIWWFALKFCYLFCGKLQEENRSKINKRLKQLMEKKDNMDEN